MKIDWHVFSFSFVAALITVLLGLRSCSSPSTPSPYPGMEARVQAVSPYPNPEETPAVIDAPTCIGAVELPIAVWSDGQNFFSQLCTNTATNGSELYLWDGASTYIVSGFRLPDVWPCNKYIHYPSLNGQFGGVVYMTDAGGVLLCNNVTLERNWHVFPVTQFRAETGGVEKIGK